MSLRFCPAPSVVAWIKQSNTPADQLIHFGPAAFEAYVRLRFAPDPVVRGQAAADAQLPIGHLPDIDQTCCALDVLAGFTSTPGECYFALWEGYSDAPLPPGIREGQLLQLPHRSYAVFQGAVNDIHSWSAEFGRGQPIPPPALVWPADRAWFFASDVDPHWAGIGAPTTAIDALLAESTLDVVAARPGDRQPSYDC